MPPVQNLDKAQLLLTNWHMSSKSIVLFSFALWSAFCTWYYLCKIKNLCDDGRKTEISAAQNVSPAVVENAVQPLENSPAETAEPAEEKTATAPPRTAAPSNSDIEKVSVVEQSDATEIHFPYNETTKEQDAEIDEYLDRLAAQAKQSGAKITIAGHTDGIGEPKSNYAIADKRARHIREILVKKGVPASQIRTKSFGESHPKATNDNPRGRYENRRVEISIE